MSSSLFIARLDLWNRCSASAQFVPQKQIIKNKWIIFSILTKWYMMRKDNRAVKPQKLANFMIWSFI